MQKFSLNSPNQRILLHVIVDDGSLFYETMKDGVVTCDRSPVGIVTDKCNFTSGLVFKNEQREVIDESYTIAAFKKSVCHNHANSLTLHFEKNGSALTVEARAYDDGAAIRLIVPGNGDTYVIDETTAYTIPDPAGLVYAQKLIFTYEDHYHPIPRSELSQNALAFPALLDAGHDVWALYAEAAVFGDYGGSNLLSTPEYQTQLKLTRSPDVLNPIKIAYPVTTPWRAVIMGSLNDIVSSNVLENLNPPSIIDDPSFIQGGVSAWSWMTDNKSTRNTKRIYEYVDFASEMKFPYYVADGGWPGHVDIPALVKYAESKHVKIWIWAHSADMRDFKTADEKMQLWSSWGVVGLKIDFFESDKPDRIAQYDMLAELGAKYRLMLNFHGATKPAGEIRTWPHVFTREGVMGGEYLQNFSTYLPGGPDAAHHCTLPFTRNAVGPMDFTPVLYNTYLTGTTDCHQTALAVIFLSYIQHIGESAENVLNNMCRPFLTGLPAVWDDGVLLEGYPANYVTMARRKGEDWYVGGICARRPRNATVDFSFLDDGEYKVSLYCDDMSDMRPFDAALGAMPAPDQATCDWIDAQRQRPAAHQHDIHLTKVEKLTVTNTTKLTVPLCVNGGFAMHITKG